MVHASLCLGLGFLATSWVSTRRPPDDILVPKPFHLHGSRFCWMAWQVQLSFFEYVFSDGNYIRLFTTYIHRTVQYVVIVAFHNRVSDPLIGGTCVTLLASFSNLNGTWPGYLVLKGGCSPIVKRLEPNF